MSIIEIIGFLISLVALMILSFKKRLDNRHQTDYLSSSDQEEEEWDRDDPIQAFLKIIEERAKKQGPTPQTIGRGPPLAPNSQAKMVNRPTVKPKTSAIRLEDQRLKSRLEDKQLHSQLKEGTVTPHNQPKEAETSFKIMDDMAEAAERRSKPSAASQLLKSLPNRKEFILYYEILGKPKRLQ